MTTTDVSCPKCGGAMWDNRATKKNPRSPDFKCKQRSCDGVIWPPRTVAAAPRPAVAAAVSEPMELGGYIPGLDDEPAPPEDATNYAPAHPNGNGTSPASRLAGIFTMQEACFLHALKLAGIAKQKGIAPSLEGVSALTAQALIAARQ